MPSEDIDDGYEISTPYDAHVPKRPNESNQAYLGSDCIHLVMEANAASLIGSRRDVCYVCVCVREKRRENMIDK